MNINLTTNCKPLCELILNLKISASSEELSPAAYAHVM